MQFYYAATYVQFFKSYKVSVFNQMRRLTVWVVPGWRDTGSRRAIEGNNREFRCDVREYLRASSVWSAGRRRARMMVRADDVPASSSWTSCHSQLPLIELLIYKRTWIVYNWTWRKRWTSYVTDKNGAYFNLIVTIGLTGEQEEEEDSLNWQR